MEWLKGKKTYFVIGISAIMWALEMLGIAPAGTLDSALPMLGMAGGATVAAKINRLAK